MEEEISLVEIGHTLLKRWKLLLFLPLIAAALAYGISIYTFTPEYRSSATLIVLPFTEQFESGDVVRHDVDSTRQVVQSCKELTLSHDSLQRIIADLNLPLEPGTLRKKIDIDVRDVTTVTVTASSPTRAYQVAGHVTEV